MPLSPRWAAAVIAVSLLPGCESLSGSDPLQNIEGGGNRGTGGSGWGSSIKRDGQITSSREREQIFDGEADAAVVPHIASGDHGDEDAVTLLGLPVEHPPGDGRAIAEAALDDRGRAMRDRQPWTRRQHVDEHNGVGIRGYCVDAGEAPVEADLIVGLVVR